MGSPGEAGGELRLSKVEERRLRGQFFAPALLEARGALHLGYRLAIRLIQLISIDGSAGPGTGWFRAALPFFAVWDVVVYFILRRSSSFGLAWRLPIDCLDMAFWTLSPHPLHHHDDFPVVIGIPLAVEGAFRIGARAAVVPVAGLVAPMLARFAAHRALYPGGFGVPWLVLGVGLGMGLYRYCALLNAQAEAERERRLAADRGRAYLAGQNAVAMGASSVVDAIEGVVPILGQPRQGSALWRLADGWKADLGSSTTHRATYLQVALLEWERDYNRHPDLSTHVTLALAEGAGTVLLTGSQVADLKRAMGALAPRGHQPVALVDEGAASRPPGRPLRLMVGGDVVEVPGDRDKPRRPVDVGPVSFVFVAAMVAHDASPDFVAVPWAVVLPGALVLVAAAFWAHRQLVARGVDARPRILRCALVITFPYTVAATVTMRQPRVPFGGTGYALGGAIMLVAFLVGGYHHLMTLRVAAFAVLAIAANCAAAVLLHPLAPSPRDVLISLAAASTPYFPFRRISGSLTRASAEHAAATHAEDEGLVLAAFEQGKAEVVDLVRAARDDARSQLASIAPQLEPEIAAAVAERLGEVDARLTVLT